MGLTERELCANSGMWEAPGALAQEAAPWFALTVKHQHERRAAGALDAAGIEAFLPLYRARRRWSDRVKELEEPLFPGYVFSRFNNGDRVRVLQAPGVRCIVGFGGSASAPPAG